jgi:hypothetical protein
MLLKNLDILLRQDLVILYFVLLNVMNVLSFDSRVFLAELTTKITKYFLISFDVLIWIIFGRVPQELLLNLQECSMKKLPLDVFIIFKCSPSLWAYSRLTVMGGVRAAIGVLHRSNRPSKHKDKLKFSSARKARSVHSNMCMTSALGGATAQSVRSDKGHKALTTAPTDTEWFGRFMTGLRARVGERRRQDAAISIALMIELQSRLEVRWLEVNKENDWQEKRKAAENDAFFVWTYCGSLRGFETPKVLLHDL